MVFLALFTFIEVLSVVLYNLSHPELQLQCFGVSSALLCLFADVLPALVAVFVVVLRFFFFLQVRFTFLRWILSPTHLTIVLTGAPAT